MAVYINDTVNTDTDCETPIPKVCGRQKVHMPTASCDTIHFTGVDDAEINQGQDFDPTEGVHAYDGNGEEIPFTVEPSEVDKCQVGEIELEYTATGVGKKLLPKLCGSPNLKLPYCGVERKRLKRNLVIKGIAPPSIRGIERVCLDRETLFNPMDGVSAVDGNGNTLEVSHSGTYDEVASGEIASFESIGGNSKSLKIELEPIQDLNGYDKPWSAGTGANKWDEVWENGWISSSGDNRDSADIIRSKNYIPVTPNTTYCIVVPSSTDIVYFDENKAAIGNTDKNGIGDTDRTVNTRTTHDNCHYIRFWTRNQTTYNHDIAINYPSTVTTYSPYSNLCPISGRTEVVTWDDPKYGGTVAWNQLVPTASRDYINTGTEAYSSIMFFFRLNASPYTQFYSTSRSTTGLFAFVKKATATGKAEMIHNGSRTQMKFANNIDVVENHYYLGMINFTSLDASTVGGVVAKDVQLFDLTQMFGSTIADYIYSLEQAHAGDGVAYFRNLFPNDYYEYNAGETTCVSAVNGDPYNHYTTSLGRTVYGGTLDVVSGELVVDRGYVDLSQQSWLYQSAWGSWYTDYFADMKGTNTGVETPNFISDRFEAIATNYGLTPQDFSGITSTTRGSLGCRILVKNGSTTEAPTGQLVYELATPQTIQLTPQEVQLLLGTNNVWSDGMVTVAYPVNIPDGAYNYPLDGAYEITYHAEDRCGNETTEVRQVIVSKSNSVCGARVCCATVAC